MDDDEDDQNVMMILLLSDDEMWITEHVNYMIILYKLLNDDNLDGLGEVNLLEKKLHLG